jgi:hypothetical protein
MLALILLPACRAQGGASQKPVYKMLFSPSSNAYGTNPASMFETQPGLFYFYSLSTGGNSIITVTSAGTSNLIYTLPTSWSVYSLLQNTNQLLYGAGAYYTNPQETSINRVYFSLDPSGKNLQQYPLPAMWGSAGRSVLAPPAEIYDIFAASPRSGTLYAFGRVEENGDITVLHQFSASEGTPIGQNLAYGADGNFYGVGYQESGGAGPGFIYRITRSGVYSQILDFPAFATNGSYFPVIAASDHNLYGVFGGTAANPGGVLYQATLSGQLQTMAVFGKSISMSQPQTLMQAGDGNIYGTTTSNAVFRYDLGTHSLSLIYQLAIAQARCACQLIQGMDGKLYGITATGGDYPGVGVVFSLDIGLAPPKPSVTVLAPAAAPVGGTVILWGQYLLAAHSVTFNGTPATTFTSTSGQSVRVTVPAGATTGPITVSTPNGSFTTTQNFTVQE